MALKTSISSGDWKEISRSQRYEVISPNQWTTGGTLAVIQVEQRVYSVEVAVAIAYMAANPTGTYELERIPNMPTGCHLTTRTETRTIVPPS